MSIYYASVQGSAREEGASVDLKSKSTERG